MKKLRFSVLLAPVFLLISCGDGPSTFLYQGRFPITNFPLFVSYSGTPGFTSGGIKKCERSGVCSNFATSLGAVEGIAIDSFGNVYSVKNYETTGPSAGTVYKFSSSGTRDTSFASGITFLKPRVIAVDSFDQVYVSEANSATAPSEYYIKRIQGSTATTIATYTSEVTSFAFGVNDMMVVCFETANRCEFGTGASKKAVSFGTSSPVGVVVDYNGRIYVTDDPGTATAKIYRFRQEGANSLSEATVIAQNLDAPKGIAIDPAENVLYVKQPLGLVKQVRYDGFIDTAKEVFASAIDGPIYLAFQKY
ncbi:MAG: hypothetical protein JNL01_08460 [Bdellovibrionales bacterium]|nr:hypothetical protein [Bdellovibrionales bacterium]